MTQRSILLLASLLFLTTALAAGADRSTGFRPPSDAEKQARLRQVDPAKDLQPAWDWREQNMVTPARDQDNCGSCWAFAIAGMVESRILIEYGEATTISTQWLVSCDEGNGGCCGGGIDGVDFLMQRGIVMEADFGYLGGDPEGPRDCPDDDRGPLSIPVVPCPVAQPEISRYTVADYYLSGYSAGAMKNALVEEGPLFVWFDYYPDFSGYWLDGDDIYRRSPEFDPDDYDEQHAVLLIGYSDERQAWLCKNSWGPGWGPHGDGTFEIAYDADCGFEGGYYCDVRQPNDFHFRRVYYQDDVPVGSTFMVGGRLFEFVNVCTSCSPLSVQVVSLESNDHENIAAGTFEHWGDVDRGIYCEGVYDDGTWRAMLHGYVQGANGPFTNTTLLKGAPGERVTVFAYPAPGRTIDDGDNVILSVSDDHNLAGFGLQIDAKDGGAWAEVELDIPDDAEPTEEPVLVGITDGDTGQEYLLRMDLVVGTEPEPPTAPGQPGTPVLFTQ